MPRISLVEAYNNRDVIAWLVKHQDAIDEMMNILQNINPDGDLTNIVLKTGDQTIDGVKTFIGKIVANCDIIQNGAAYETHAEQIFTKNDYIVMREGALGGLQPGEFSGFRINRYDSVHDGHLVIDSTGTARVGDVGDEKPLLVRDEAADLTNGDVLKWDSSGLKAIGIGVDTNPSSDYSKLVSSGGVYSALNGKQDALSTVKTTPASGFTVTRYGNVVTISIFNIDCGAGQTFHLSDLPSPTSYCIGTIIKGDYSYGGTLKIAPGETSVTVNQVSAGNVYGSITYITE